MKVVYFLIITIGHHGPNLYHWMILGSGREAMESCQAVATNKEPGRYEICLEAEDFGPKFRQYLCTDQCKKEWAQNVKEKPWLDGWLPSPCKCERKNEKKDGGK